MVLKREWEWHLCSDTIRSSMSGSAFGDKQSVYIHYLLYVIACHRVTDIATSFSLLTVTH